jgi:hypothetical protein
MRMGSTVGLALTVAVLASSATRLEAKEGFLKHLDTLMQNYAGSFYKEGSPGDVAEKWFRGGPKVWFSLKEMDTTMRAYGDAQQKVGEQALADLKVVLKDLISFKTYLPSGVVDSLATLKARFLARAANPWADDAGGGAAADFSPSDSGGEDGSLPESGSMASSIRAPAASKTKGKTEDRGGMRDSFESFVGFRKNAQKAVKASEKLDADKKTAIQAAVLKHARQMEETLVARLSRNETAIDELARYCDSLDAPTARGCFASAAGKLVRVTNSAAMSGDKSAKKRAEKAAALKAKLKS